MPLNKIRQVISVIFFLLFALLFLDVEPLSVYLADLLPPFQALPALMRAITAPAFLFTAGLMIILLVTLFFGRVYCSFLCPLGALQDFVIAGSRRMSISRQHTFSKPLNILRHAILALTVLAAVAGSLDLVSLLDPYSLAGRFFSQLLQPLLVRIYNLGIVLLKPFDIYWRPQETAWIFPPALAITAGFFLPLCYLAATRGRLYCNALCPVGTFLGLLARKSVFYLAADRQTCLGCARCAKVCKASCLDPQAALIDMSRCVGCGNCLSACPQAVIRYRKRQGQEGAEHWSPARRSLIVGGVAAASSLVLWAANIRSFMPVLSAGAHPPVTPPGSLNTERYTTTCTSCSLCVSVCPTKVLTPSFMDFGPSGLLQPKMNFEKSYCDYECNLCGRVCPTGAILPMKLDEKKLTQIGVAELFKDVCVVHVNHRNCGACGEVCPTHAIRFTDRKNILYPEIDRQYCVGCGACRLACPTTPKSIVVHAHPVHQKAVKYLPPARPAGQKKPSDADFPF